MLDFAAEGEAARERLYREGGVLKVRLEQVRGADAERFKGAEPRKSVTTTPSWRIRISPTIA